MYKGPERRKYKRAKKPYILRFHIREKASLAQARKVWDMVAVIDIGAGGTMFYYNRKLDLGTGLDLLINYSPSKPPLECSAKIIRVLPLPADFLYITAIVFDQIDEDDRKALNDTIEAFHSTT